MNEELEKFVNEYLVNNGGKLQPAVLYDEIKRNFPDLSNREIIIVIADLLVEGKVSLYTKVREWFEKAKREHRNGKDCEFPSLNKYFEAIEKHEKGEDEAASQALEEAKEKMNNEAVNGCPFVKEMFEKIINDGFQEL